MPTSEQNKAIVRRVFEEAVNQGKLDLLGQLIADDYTGVNSGAPIKGPEGFAKPIRGLKEAFPDIHYNLDEVIAEGNVVAAHWHWTGTHRGTFHGPAGTYPPSGKQVENEGMAIFEVRDGKLTHASLLTDRLGFLQAVGAAPR